MSEETEVPKTDRRVIYELASGGGVLIRDHASLVAANQPLRIRQPKQLAS